MREGFSVNMVSPPNIETPVSSVTLVQGNILHWVYHEGVEVSLAIAEEEVSLIEPFHEAHVGGPTRLLIDIRAVRSMDRAACKLFASDRIHDDYQVMALGLVTNSSASAAVIGNFFMKVFGPKHPVRLFKTEDEALNWLNLFV